MPHPSAVRRRTRLAPALCAAIAATLLATAAAAQDAARTVPSPLPKVAPAPADPVLPAHPPCPPGSHFLGYKGHPPKAQCGPMCPPNQHLEWSGQPPQAHCVANPPPPVQHHETPGAATARADAAPRATGPLPAPRPAPKQLTPIDPSTITIKKPASCPPGTRWVPDNTHPVDQLPGRPVVLYGKCEPIMPPAPGGTPATQTQ
ncbi:hypothetical protein [Thermomonas flagellata]|uniref:hypothetical protein n=1 Tax=Thermomonas flagellata TaxID=2888524 RepID=UPI001F04B741|nr:hypothetical protein [Thermomonas flagellata]